MLMREEAYLKVSSAVKFHGKGRLDAICLAYPTQKGLTWPISTLGSCLSNSLRSRSRPFAWRCLSQTALRISPISYQTILRISPIWKPKWVLFLYFDLFVFALLLLLLLLYLASLIRNHFILIFNMVITNHWCHLITNHGHGLHHPSSMPSSSQSSV